MLEPRPRLTLVEDDAFLLGALSFALEAEGYRVFGFTSAAETLARIEATDCLVIDFRLPDMDGLTLIARLREQGLREPAILITPNLDERCRHKAGLADVDIVEKPLLTAELGRRIEARLAGWTAR